MYCKKCGTEITDNVCFCKICGAKIKTRKISINKEIADDKSQSKVQESHKVKKKELESEKKKEKKRLFDKIIDKIERAELRKEKEKKLREIENRRNQVKLKRNAYICLGISALYLCLELIGVTKSKYVIGFLASVGVAGIFIGGIMRLFIVYDELFYYEKIKVYNALLKYGVFLLIISAPGIYETTIIASFVISFIIGITMYIYVKSRNSKWNLYDSKINHWGNTDLDVLASKLDKSYKKICVELQDMISKEFFSGPNCDIVAIIDKERHLLVMTRDGVPLVPIEEQEKNVVEDEIEKIEIMQKYVGVIKKSISYAESFGDDEIKRSLNNLENSTCRILNKIHNNPELESAQAVIKWQKNYLPKTIKLVETYMDDTISKSTLSKIKEILHTCAESFVKLDEKLSQFEDVEILADIKVLKSALARDDISELDFDIENV